MKKGLLKRMGVLALSMVVTISQPLTAFATSGDDLSGNDIEISEDEIENSVLKERDSLDSIGDIAEYEAGEGNESIETSSVETKIDINLTSNSVSIDKPRMVDGVSTWDCIWFGNYWQEDTNDDGHCYSEDTTVNGTNYIADDKQPIKWRVLDIDSGGNAFLLADKLIDIAKYNEKMEEIYWFNSTVRSYLNSYGSRYNKSGIDFSSTGFLTNAFSPIEREAISVSTIENPVNPYYRTSSGPETSDKLFLLSTDEALVSGYGFKVNSFYGNQATSKDSTRVAYTTMFAADKPGYYTQWGAHMFSRWWLRTSCFPSSSSTFVNHTGAVYAVPADDDCWVARNNYCLRPAFRLNLSSSSSLWSYAGTVCSDGTVNEITPTNTTPNYFHYGDHTYRLFTVEKSWDDAEEYCESLGGHLVTISSKEENYAVYEGCLGGMEKPSAWIGLRQTSILDDGTMVDPIGSGTWLWVDELANNSLTSYRNWHKSEEYGNEPNGDGKWVCFFETFNDGTWNDDGRDKNAFICEWDYVVVESISLNQRTLNIEIGRAEALTTIIFPADATNQSVLWRSGDPSIARVTSSGVVIAHSVGKTTVFATTEDGGFVAKCGVAVTEKTGNSTDIEFNGRILSLENWRLDDLFVSEEDVVTSEAAAALALSRAAYISSDEVDALLWDLGLIEEVNDWARWPYCYDGPGTVHTISVRRYNGHNIITLVVKGTQLNRISDILADIAPDGFRSEGNAILGDLKTFLSDRGINIGDSENVFFLTGHSLGGAVAGNIAKSLETNEGVTSDRITCYTFGSPYTVYDLREYNNNREWYYIHNIVNKDDFVPRYPQAQVYVGRWGKDHEYNPTDRSTSFTTWYTFLTDRDYWKHVKGTAVDDILLNHIECEVYMALVLSKSNSRKNKERLVSVRCPVDVGVVDQNGTVVASIVDNEVTKRGDEDILIVAVGDEKYVVFKNGGKEYYLRLTGTNTGTMTYEVRDIQPSDTGNIVDASTKVFANVVLFDGKEMSSDIADEIGTDDIKLYVTDENNNPIKEISTDGRETEYDQDLDYGDVLAEDIPSDGNIPSGIWLGGVSNLSYDGTKQTQEFRVYDGTNLLVAGTDYTVSYKNNLKAYSVADVSNPTAADKKSAPQIIVTMKGNYSGKNTAYFSINPLSIEDNVSFCSYMKKSGETQNPVLLWNGKTLKKKTDYTVTKTGLTVTITGKGNFSGTRTLNISDSFDAPKQVLMSKVKVTSIPPQVYKGSSYTVNDLKTKDGKTSLDFVVSFGNDKLTAGIDYKVVKILNAKAVGKATVVLRGLNAGGGTGASENSFVGEKRISFRINGYPMTGDKIRVTSSDGSETLFANYQKAGAQPDLIVKYDDVTLRKGRDYTVKYSGNTKYPATKASVTITGKGNYSSKLSKKFSVTQRTFSTADGIRVIANNKAYSSKANQYKTTVRVYDYSGKLLKAGTDYDSNILYMQNGKELTSSHPKVGESVTVRVTGKGGYTSDSIDATYTILASGAADDIGKATIKIKNQDYNSGKAVSITSADQISQAVIGKSKTALAFSTDNGSTGDFMVLSGSYVGNTNKGTAQVTFVGINRYSGTKTVKFKIGRRSIADIWFGWLFPKTEWKSSDTVKNPTSTYGVSTLEYVYFGNYWQDTDSGGDGKVTQADTKD